MRLKVPDSSFFADSRGNPLQSPGDLTYVYSFGSNFVCFVVLDQLSSDCWGCLLCKRIFRVDFKL